MSLRAFSNSGPNPKREKPEGSASGLVDGKPFGFNIGYGFGPLVEGFIRVPLNDIEALDGAFWNSPHTVRLGVAENLWSFDEIAAFRVRRDRQNQLAKVAGGRGTLEEMMKGIRDGTAKELPVLIKADVQGSAEAIVGSLAALPGASASSQ